MIHPTAIVEKGAELGEGVEIGPYAFVGAKAKVGDRCRLGMHSMVMDYTTLGADCVLHPGAVLGDLPQDLGYKGWPSYLEVGEGCEFREFATVHRGAAEGTVTRIGNHVYMMATSHAGHNAQVGDHVVMANGALLAGHVVVGDHCFLGGTSAIHQFCRLGRFVMICGVMGVGQDVPPFCTTYSQGQGGIVSGLNVVGLRRGGFTPEQRLKIKRAYDAVYRKGLNARQAREALEAMAAEGNEFAKEYADFIAGSKRGLASCCFRKEHERLGGGDGE